MLLQLEHLTKRFTIRGRGWRRQHVLGLDDVTLHLARGETLGLVGASGCGKTTLARCVVRLLRPSSGRVIFDGRDLAGLSPRRLRRERRRFQMVFQDPAISLNPRIPAGKMIAEPLKVHGLARGPAIEERVRDLLDRVGLDPDSAQRLPEAFSGGQKQRLAIARALSVKPDLIVADEPTSSLDVSIQAQIINLLLDIQAAEGIAYLFVSHDLCLVGQISDRIAVMHRGRIVEGGPTLQVFEQPLHPYTASLLETAQANATTDGGSRPLQAFGGCLYWSCCQQESSRCRNERPELRDATNGGHLVACHKR